jgi:serine/threonine protein kinase
MARLGKFEIHAELGHGGMGVVYRAWDPRMQRWVALKTMHPDKAGRAEFIQRFHREGVCASRLNHPNIVTIYDFGEEEGIHYIATEFLEGADLETLLSSARWGTEFTIQHKIDILIQVARALAYAHRNGVVHGDVKPANIMVVANGTIKLLDFGIARLREETWEPVMLGTAPYVAPEELQGEPMDERVDVFAMGCIGYRMFTGHFPFEAPNLSGIFYKIVHDQPPPLSSYLSDYPPLLEQILFKALAKKSDERYRAVEMAVELQQLLSPSGVAVVLHDPESDQPGSLAGTESRDAALSSVFISYAEEDEAVAHGLAGGIEAAGYKAWYYARDSVPGPPYLIQVGQAIERAAAVLLVISRDSVGSSQVTSEVVRAHECGKPFLPVLVGITHVEFQQRQPLWRQALGAATSISVPPAGIAAIVPRIVDGLAALGIACGRAEPSRVDERPGKSGPG